jgi:hypothetical protein
MNYKSTAECPKVKITSNFQGTKFQQIVSPILGNYDRIEDYIAEYRRYFPESKFEVLYPRILDRVEIHQIRENGQLLGYFAHGHWNCNSFAIACHKDFGIDPIVHGENVHNGWMMEFDCTWGTSMFFTDRPIPVGNGGRAVTYWQI